jgi:hypothetical protein
MGARHQRSDDPTNTPFPYGHGFLDSSARCRVRSIMGTDGCCGRVGFWSHTNPKMPRPCPAGFGTNDVADNARALNESAKAVASFRCSSPLRKDVWMRDTWNDRGDEPDAATTTDVMWRSPYIWIRMKQDVDRIHQHLHETPPLNSQVYAYVKIHNSSPDPASGTLELHYANASTALSFPDSAWTLIGSIAVSGTDLPAATTKVFEFPWKTPATTPLGSGRFTYLARWISTTDPIVVPSTDVETIARNSNNVVWRSDEIAGQGHAPPYASFVVRNPPVPPGQANEPVTLAITPSPEEVNGSIFFYARGLITLSEDVAAAWREGGKRGQGFVVQTDGRLLVTAPNGVVLENIRLMREGTVRVDFERTAETQRRDYRIVAFQIAGGRRLGGVTFEVKSLQ